MSSDTTGTVDDSQGRDPSGLSPERRTLVYTPEEVAKILGLGRNTVYEQLAQNVIPHVRVGRRFLIPRARLESWLNECGVEKEVADVAHMVPAAGTPIIRARRP